MHEMFDIGWTVSVVIASIGLFAASRAFLYLTRRRHAARPPAGKSDSPRNQEDNNVSIVESDHAADVQHSFGGAAAPAPTYDEQLQHEVEVRKEVEARLLVAMEVAEAANAAKSEFLANISHELRTPMTAIIASTQLLLHHAREDHQREILGIISSSSDMMMKLINDLLDFARTEAGRVELEKRVFTVRESLSAIFDGFALRAKDKGLELTCRIHDSVPSILVGDVERLKQIMNNLLDNALKFTPSGRIRCDVDTDMDVRYSSSDDPLDFCLHISVCDTGVGIPADKHDAIFEPFRQVDGSSTRRFGGTGLGLAITRELVEMMDGRIWVDSEEGRGSTFHCIVVLSHAETGVPLGE